ncbi:MAG: SDR family NAD(P)-dependent oxidoreductase, partial [Bacillota bacterium]
MEIMDFNMDMFNVEGKNAVVTGGNTGLGQAFSTALAKAGANVMAVSIMDDDGETREMIESTGSEYKFMEADITEEGNCKKVVEACVEEWGSIDILVNCAGIS